MDASLPSGASVGQGRRREVDPHGPTASSVPKMEELILHGQTGGSEMDTTRTVVGVDTSKRVFQLYWVEPETGECMGAEAHAGEVPRALRQPRPVPGRDGGVRRVAALGPPAPGARSRGPTDSGEEGACVRRLGTKTMPRMREPSGRRFSNRVFVRSPSRLKSSRRYWHCIACAHNW